jgi:hypothetical protein
MNPDILPTLEEWKLICKMVKQQQEEIKALKNIINDGVSLVRKWKK